MSHQKLCFQSPKTFTPKFFYAVHVWLHHKFIIFIFQDYASDPDFGDNAKIFYHIDGPMSFSSELQGRFDTPPFSLGIVDGIIRTDVYFQDDMQGYIQFKVNITDVNPEHVDEADISVSVNPERILIIQK